MLHFVLPIPPTSLWVCVFVCLVVGGGVGTMENVLSFFIFLLTVTLLVVPTSGSISFKGFLIEARDAENPDGPAVGSFSLLNPSESQLLHCGHTQVEMMLPDLNYILHDCWKHKLSIVKLWLSGITINNLHQPYH